jgi:heme/copper-type cytochrome/quinol oxidase subunit 3
MYEQIQPDSIRDIQDIKKIMERSSRFISLSGLSGIAAGICALAGSYFAYDWIAEYYVRYDARQGFAGPDFENLKLNLLLLSAGVLGAALILAYFFTWRRARHNHMPVWDLSSRKLVWNMLVPLGAGGLFILAMLQYNEWRFVAPACLIFYGIALVNGSKYTVSDIRYLGYMEILLGLACSQFPGYGLYFWAAGFGALHIIYGLIMWLKYERK